MLSVTGSNGHCWLCTFCKAIQQHVDPDGHDYDDPSVQQIFAAGEDWALDHKIPVPKGDHAQAFINARDRSEEPVIPEFMRAFCAQVTATQVTADIKADEPPVCADKSHAVTAKKAQPMLRQNLGRSPRHQTSATM